MTETTALPPPPDAPAAWPPPPSPPPPAGSQRSAAPYLLRSSTERILAGVAGGVGQRLGIDPLMLRLLIVVLAFFGGAGILLYAVGWLLLDVDDGRGRSLLEDAFDPQVPGRARNLFTVACLVVVIGVSGLWVLAGHPVPALLVVLTVVALFLYARRDGGRPPGPYGPTGEAHSPYGPPPSPTYAARPGPAPEAGSEPTGAFAGTEPTVAFGDTRPTVGFAGGSSPAPPASPPTTYSRTPPPVPPRPRRERSHLGPLTISLAILGLGGLAAVDLGFADVPGSAYVVLPLAVVALGLLVGTWYGRSRGLIVLGVVLSAALIPAVVLDKATNDDWSQLRRWDNAQTLRETPLSPEEIRPTYDIGAGRLVLDLRDVDFTGADVTTSLLMGAGEVLVLLPADVNLVATATVDLGEFELLGRRSAGVNADADVADLGAAGTAGGDLNLIVHVNLGRAEVQREAA